MLQQTAKKQKTSNKRSFWMPPDFDTQKMNVYVGKHYSGTDMPMIKNASEEQPRYDNKTIVSCYASTIYSNMGPNADQGTCNGMITEPQHFTIDLTQHLPEWFEKLVPGSQHRLDNFFETIPSLIDSMWDQAWDTAGIFVKHKEKARKEAKKTAKVKGDYNEIAKKIFIQNGTVSILKEYTDEDGDEQPRIHLRRKYASKAGYVMRPTIWRKDKETGIMKDITEDIAFISRGAIVKVDFQLNMYDLPQKYGIQGALGRNCVLVWMDAPKKSENTKDMDDNIPVIDF